MRLANWKLIKELVELSDVVLEVVDIRDPILTRSPKLESTVSRLSKHLIIVLNKSDLVPRSVSEAWKEYFEMQDLNAIYISARERLGSRVLRKTIRRVTSKKPVVLLVAGLPKVGKSTLINTLKGRHSASTSSLPGSPGYTTRAQLYRIGGGMYLIDTPGLIPPESNDVEVVIRAKPIEELDNIIDCAIKLIRKVLQHNRLAFKEAYGIDGLEPQTILETIARSRGWISKEDAEPLINEAAKAVIRDYLEGKITYYYYPPNLTRTERQNHQS